MKPLPPPPELRTDVAVLYCDPRSVYPQLVADWWDEKRDARLYAGPNPVVAHPPCGPWAKLRAFSNGAGAELGPIAVQQVQCFGGILEQPAYSRLWDVCGLPRPFTEGDGIGFTLQVEQVNWGHPARKRTWLYMVGVNRSLAVSGVKFGAEPTKWVSGTRKQSPDRGTTPAHLGFCSNAQRRRTPIAFALWLLDLAAKAGKSRAA